MWSRRAIHSVAVPCSQYRLLDYYALQHSSLVVPCSQYRLAVRGGSVVRAACRVPRDCHLEPERGIPTETVTRDATAETASTSLPPL